MTTVEAIMCSLNEEKYIRDALASALHQSLIADNPGMVAVTLADSGSTDDTVRIAETFESVNIMDVPVGKLTARDVSIRSSNADIIIALDSDTYYPYGFYATLVRHFSDPSVVAVGGYMHMDHIVAKMVSDMAAFGNITGFCRRMLGGASAFKRSAYLDTGGFRLGTNQKDIVAMVMEEEFAFGDRLACVGKYVFEPMAIAFSSSRRFNLDPSFIVRQMKRETF